MLLSWAESSRSGRSVTFRLPEDEPEHPFRQLQSAAGKQAGARFMAVLVAIDDQEEPDKRASQKPYGQNARQLHAKGWFFDRRVITAIGSTEEFRAWASKQPCLVCKNAPPSNVLRGHGYTALPVCNLHRHTDAAAVASHNPRLIKEWISAEICKIAGEESLGYIMPSYFAAICDKLGIKHTIPEAYFDREEDR